MHYHTCKWYIYLFLKQQSEMFLYECQFLTWQCDHLYKTTDMLLFSIFVAAFCLIIKSNRQIVAAGKNDNPNTHIHDRSLCLLGATISIQRVCVKHNAMVTSLPSKSSDALVQEEFEDTKGAIRNRIPRKNRQHNGQKKKYKRKNNDRQNIHIKLKIE